MRNGSLATIGCALAAACLLAGGAAAAPAPAAPPQRPFHNFSVAIYIPVASTRELADPQVLRRQFERIWSQVHFNKVYLEDYRGGVFADPASLDRIAHFFRRRGITVDGGITLTAPGRAGRLFSSFDYEQPQDLATAERAVRMAASHFNTVILDDFTFYNTRSDWPTSAPRAPSAGRQYRLRKMRLGGEARHPRYGPQGATRSVKVIIKYPNWYEHFQGLGFDLDARPAAVRLHLYGHRDARSGRDVSAAAAVRELSRSSATTANPPAAAATSAAGWTPSSTRYADRYAEQLWDTMFAKAPEITLFSWTQLASPAPAIAGERPWAADDTSFDWSAMADSFHAPAATPEAVPGWAHVAGWSLGAGRRLSRPARPADRHRELQALPVLLRGGLPAELSRQHRHSHRPDAAFPQGGAGGAAHAGGRLRSRHRARDRGQSAGGRGGDHHLRPAARARAPGHRGRGRDRLQRPADRGAPLLGHLRASRGRRPR